MLSWICNKLLHAYEHKKIETKKVHGMKKVWIFFLFGIITTNMVSQISKVGFFAGVSNYSGELGSISNGNLPAFGMSYKYQFKENLSFYRPDIYSV